MSISRREKIFFEIMNPAPAHAWVYIMQNTMVVRVGMAAGKKEGAREKINKGGREKGEN